MCPGMHPGNPIDLPPIQGPEVASARQHPPQDARVLPLLLGTHVHGRRREQRRSDLREESQGEDQSPTRLRSRWQGRSRMKRSHIDTD